MLKQTTEVHFEQLYNVNTDHSLDYHEETDDHCQRILNFDHVYHRVTQTARKWQEPAHKLKQPLQTLAKHSLKIFPMLHHP